MSVIYVVVARIPVEGIDRFQRYEAAVLPLLAAHGGVLERRLRSVDGTVEVHVVRFTSAAAVAAYRDDPRRLAHQEDLLASGAELELHELDDV